MPIAESIKFLAATWFFMRGFIRAVLTYMKDAESKWPKTEEVRGIGLKHKDMQYDNLPSIIEIKKALPRRCFQPKIPTSMYYAIKDVTLAIITYVIFTQVEKVLPMWPLQAVWTLLYWAVQGTIFTAIFVVGHDCGHGSFSNCELLNDTMGTVLHASIMAPYYMWKLTHRLHHKFNANFDKDEVFYPIRESEPCTKSPTLPAFGFGVGWFAYLVVGYSPRNVNHFDLRNPLFIHHTAGCLATLFAMAVTTYCMFMYGAAFGIWALFSHYLMPVFVFACYMVVITFLHHNEVNIPWYADEKWDFVRGQLSTVDRHYGYMHYIIHNIGTHQMHHMFAKIPHYHLEEATTAFRAAFPHLVRACDEPIMPSFMRMFQKYAKQCVMPDDTKIYSYK